MTLVKIFNEFCTTLDLDEKGFNEILQINECF